MNNTLLPQTVLHQFQVLTGIRLRVISHNMEAQAIDFCKAGFTIEELEQVIRWTQQQVQSGKNGYSPLSLQWHVIMGRYGTGNDFETFQTRLALAQKTVRLRPEPRQQHVTRAVGPGQSITVLADPEPPPALEAGKLVAEQLAEFRKVMGGGAA